MQTNYEAEQLSMYAPDTCAGKTCPALFPAEQKRERTFAVSSRKLYELKYQTFQSLDLTPGAGNLLGEFYWELISPWRGDALTLNTGVSPREEKESSLSRILQADPPQRYFLSPKACLGILRRAFERGKELPSKLKRALLIQAGIAAPDGKPTELKSYHINQRDEGIDLNCKSGALMATSNMQMQTFVTQPDDNDPIGFDGYNGDLTGNVSSTLGVNCGMSTGRNGVISPMAFAANQRDEVRDLHDVAGALGAQPGMKQQTFIAQEPELICLNDQGGDRMDVTSKVTSTLRASMSGHPPLVSGFTAAFSAGQGIKAGGIGYAEECAPTLKAAESGTNMVPSVLCLNDQGGKVMEWSEDMTGTLRAQEHGHQPLVFENHGIDSRYNGPLNVFPTMSARYGTGFSDPYAHDTNSHD